MHHHRVPPTSELHRKTYSPQCGSCRGLFLDFGELEHLTQMEGRFVSQAPPPPGYGPAWGKHGDRRYRKGGLAGLFFSS
ncbi:zf-TFIIB domain-containing protein [Tessaracoccus sp. O5.2]|uniref:zf-TFIIB domain-containing protein n=1 Tax=Tessaracoccus sp. O5.2 TaxID=3157622 RepID=UPI0036DD1816